MPAALALLLLLLTGTLVPVNRAFRQMPDGIPVFVLSNGFHTSLVLPLRESRTHIEWLPQFNQPAWESQFGAYRYVAFGWGSERFFLASYHHHFPGPGPIARALVPGPTLLNVEFYRNAPQLGHRAVQLRISAAQYQALARQIKQTFQADSLGHFQLRNAAGYTSEDFFFRAQGRYHALRTCNDWTTHALRKAGLRAALKAPLAPSVLWQVRRAQ